MIASLPMYDWPETRRWTDAWWQGIAARLGSSVQLLRQADHAALWSRPDLLFSQTCGYPFTHGFAGRLTLVATPHYGVDGCRGPDYQSIVLARGAAPLDAFRGSRAAVNSPDSMSGMLAMKLVFAPLAGNGQFFGCAIETGGHLASMQAVREGKADVCCIDAVCMALARRYRPGDLDGLVEVGRSPLVPGLPYVTVAGDAAVLRRALEGACADPELAEARDHLFLTGFSNLEVQDYHRIIGVERQMQNAGGLILL